MNLAHYSLAQIHGRLRQGDLSAHALMQACADHYRLYEPSLKAYKTWNGDAALARAALVDQLLSTGVDLGLLMGLPVSVKDLYAVRGLPTFAGSSAALGPAWEQPGPLVAGLDRQLALFTGKTHTVEFAFGGIGTNTHWGAPRNPWGEQGDRIPGGSSSGAGVSLAQGSALLALGTDTAGSVRVPASLTGATALKTTLGRWPSAGIVPLSFSLDTPGVLARTIEDLIFGFQAIETGLKGAAPAIDTVTSFGGLRLGVAEDFFLEDADDSIISLFRSTLGRLADFGAHIDAVKIPACDDAYAVFQQGGLAASELCAFLKSELPGTMDRLDPLVRLRVAGAETLSSVDYLLRVQALQHAARQAQTCFDEVDVVLTPTVAITPPRLVDIQAQDAYARANMLVLRNTCIANLLGLCALTLPIGLDTDGMPVGLQLMAGAHQEERLLAIARLFESRLGKPVDLLGRPPL